MQVGQNAAESCPLSWTGALNPLETLKITALHCVTAAFLGLFSWLSFSPFRVFRVFLNCFSFFFFFLENICSVSFTV